MHLLADCPPFNIASDSGSLRRGGILHSLPVPKPILQLLPAVPCSGAEEHAVLICKRRFPLSDTEASRCQCQGHCPQVTGPALTAGVQLPWQCRMHGGMRGGSS